MNFLFLIVNYIAFFFTAFISFYIPGKILLEILLNDKNLSQFEQDILALFCGITLFILISYLGAYVHIPFITVCFVFLCCFSWTRKNWRKKLRLTKHLKGIDRFILWIIMIGSLIFTSEMFFSGWQTANGLQFYGVNAVDGIRHLSYIADQRYHFPPQQPNVSGIPLKGFHYFYDFLLSRFSLFYRFTVIDLYFRFFPLLISFLYGSGMYVFVRSITKNKIQQRFVVFLTYFSQGGSLFFYLFNHKLSFVFTSITQPMQLIFNPFIVLSLGILFICLRLLPLLKQSWRYGILIGLLFGILAEIKVYSGIIAIGVLVVYALLLFIQHRKKYIFPIGLTLSITGILTLLTYFPNNFGNGKLVFSPLLFFRQYTQHEIMADYNWDLRYVLYVQQHNYLRLFWLYIVAIGFFILLNFGIRLIIFFGIKRIFKKKFWHEQNILLATAILIPILIGSFFVQSVSVFDTVQFFWIVIVLLSIPAGILLGSFFTSPIKKLLIILVLCIMTLPGFLAKLYQPIFSNDFISVSNANMQVLSKAKSIVPQNAYILLVNFPDLSPQHILYPHDTPFITGLTQRNMYYEEGWLPTKDETPFQKREKIMQALEQSIKDCLPNNITSIIKKINTPYIITIGNYPCLRETFHIKQKIEIPHATFAFYQINI